MIRFLNEAPRVFVLLLRRETPNIPAILANSLLLPACVCYSAFMFAPDDAAVRRIWILGGLVLALGTSSMSQVYMGVAVDRFRGGLQLLQSLAVSRVAYLAGYMGYGAVLALLAGLAAAVLLVATGLASPAPHQLLELMAICAASGLSLGAVGAAIALRAPSFGVGDTMSTVGGLGLGLASPVFYAPDRLWPGLEALSWVSPYTHSARLLSGVLDGQGLEVAHMAALIGVGALGAVFAGSARVSS